MAVSWEAYSQKRSLMVAVAASVVGMTLNQTVPLPSIVVIEDNHSPAVAVGAVDNARDMRQEKRLVNRWIAPMNKVMDKNRWKKAILEPCNDATVAVDDVHDDDV